MIWLATIRFAWRTFFFFFPWRAWMYWMDYILWYIHFHRDSSSSWPQWPFPSIAISKSTLVNPPVHFLLFVSLLHQESMNRILPRKRTDESHHDALLTFPSVEQDLNVSLAFTWQDEGEGWGYTVLGLPSNQRKWNLLTWMTQYWDILLRESRVRCSFIINAHCLKSIIRSGRRASFRQGATSGFGV